MKRFKEMINEIAPLAVAAMMTRMAAGSAIRGGIRATRGAAKSIGRSGADAVTSAPTPDAPAPKVKTSVPTMPKKKTSVKSVTPDLEGQREKFAKANAERKREQESKAAELEQKREERKRKRVMLRKKQSSK